MKVTSYPGIFINGYNFHTFEHGAGKASMNWGVCVRGSDSDDPVTSFYGNLKDILVLNYHSRGSMATVVLFECDWFDPNRGMNVHPTYKLIEINTKKMYPKYDPFVLAQQVIQVYFCHYPGASRQRSSWMAVCETRCRRVIRPRPNQDADNDDEMAYQTDIQPTPAVTTSSERIQLCDMSGINLVVDLGDLRQVEEDDSEGEFDDTISSSTEEDDDDVDGYNPNEF